MSKHSKQGVVLLLVGIVLICGALGIHLTQQWEDRLAGESAAGLLRQLELNRLPFDAEHSNVQLPQENVQSKPQTEQQIVQDVQMPEKTFSGYTLSGSLRIRSVGIHLPILSNWDYDKLKVAPCRYRGSISGENLIIMGHNYKSHFTPLHNVAVGDAVEFENTNGKVFRYRVAQIIHLERSEGEKLESGYPLTLFTCTPGGLERVIVRCEYA